MSVPKQIERIAYRFSDKPLVIVFNKTEPTPSLPRRRTTSRQDQGERFARRAHADLDGQDARQLHLHLARERDNIENLKTMMYNRVRELHVQKYPYNDFLYQTYEE